jgi:predicted lysophospholipase L1 biosynthesis ABC-type transport system permease subunit
LGFEEKYQAGVRDFLVSLPGVTAVRMNARAKLRLTRVDGTPAGNAWLIPNCGGKEDGVAPGQAVLSQETAWRLHARPGSILDFEGADSKIHVGVRAPRPMAPDESSLNGLELDCSGINPADLFYEAVADTRPGETENVRAALNERYPALAAILSTDIEEAAEAIAADANLMARLVSWYVIGSGVVVLIAMMAASRSARLREMGILAALGARRKTLIWLFTIEFSAAGAIAGAIGAALSFGYASVILSVIFNRLESVTDWRAACAAMLIAIAIAVFGGWLPTYGCLKRTPVEILRDE